MKKVNTESRKQLPLFAGKRYIFFIVIIVVVIGALCGRGLWAKYVSQEEKEPLYVAENFYFESDYLVEPSSGENGSFIFKEGVNSISILLRNFTDELRYSEVDINYTITIEGLNYEKQTRIGKLEKGKQSQAVITFDNLPEGPYTITAVSNPYSKTLQGTFKIRNATSDISYVVSDNIGSPFLEVVITSTDYTGDVTILLPTGVRPDNTDSLMKDATTTNCTVSMKAYSSDTFLFFKDDPKTVYNDTQIKVEKVTTID